MPTSASASTGPSLRPSPTIATSPVRLPAAGRARPAWPPATGPPRCPRSPTAAPTRRAAGARSPVRSVTSQPEAAQRLDRRARLGKRRVVERQHGADPPAPSRHRSPNDRSPPATAPARRAPAKAASRARASRRRSRRPPARRRRCRGCRGRARRGHRWSATGSMPRSAAAVDDGARQPVLGMALQPGGAGEHLVALRPFALDADDARLARRERAGLVEGEQPRCAPGPRARPGRGRGSRSAPAARCRARSRAARRGRPRRDRRPPAPRARPAAPGRTAPTAPNRATVSPPRTRTSGTERPTTRSARRWSRAAAGERLADRAADLRPAGRGPRAAAVGSAAGRRD